MNLHNLIRANYDRLSRVYDWFAWSEKRFTEAGLHFLDLKPGQCILELGCGTGYALRRLAKVEIRATGLDLSAGMLTRARQAGIRYGKRAVLCQGDALHIPIKSSYFNAVLLSFTLELFPENEIPLVLAECRRLLRWNGRLVVVALARENILPVRLYDWFHTHWSHVIDCRPIFVHTALIKAGYEVHEVRRMVMWGLPVEVVCAIPS